MLSKYREPPDSETLDELFEQALEDMMLKEDQCKKLRESTPERKWLFIKNQNKVNIQGSFSILSTIDLLKAVFVYSFY